MKLMGDIKNGGSDMTLEQAKEVLRIVMGKTNNGITRQAIEVVLRELAKNEE